MTNAALRRWLLISLFAFIALLIDREVSRAQSTDGADLSIELVDPKVRRSWIICTFRKRPVSSG